jgi:hypothetical protein
VTSLPNLITNTATLSQGSVARPQSVTQTVGQAVVNTPERQPQGRVGEVSWSTQVRRYLHSNPGSVRT